MPPPRPLDAATLASVKAALEKLRSGNIYDDGMHDSLAALRECFQKMRARHQSSTCAC